MAYAQRLKQRSTGFLPYPGGSLRPIARLPLQLYRLGLGWLLGPVPLLILTARGRSSGLPRHTVLEYRRHGSKYYLISGWGAFPDWVKNIERNPQVTIQHGSTERAARASVVKDTAEALRAVYMFRRNSPLAEVILSSMSSADTIDLRTLTRVANEFTVVRLDPEPGEPPLPGVEARYRWLGLLLLAGLALWLLWRVMNSAQTGKHA